MKSSQTYKTGYVGKYATYGKFNIVKASTAPWHSGLQLWSILSRQEKYSLRAMT